MINQRAKELITKEKYGKFAPIFQELISRAITEYDLSSEYYVDRFVQLCQKIKIGKMPKEIGYAWASANCKNKTLTINKKKLRDIQKNNSKEAYEYLLHIINHEMYHFLNDNREMQEIYTALNESITELASNRVSYGKNKENIKEYRNQTDGYPNLTFAPNILAAAMGISEKELIKLSFEHKIPEVLSKQLHSNRDAKEFLTLIGKELEIIHNTTYSKDCTKEELQQIQTKSYHSIYLIRKKFTISTNHL